MTAHRYEVAGFQPFGRGHVRVIRCARCGCGPDWALARQDCPPGLRAGLTRSADRARRHTEKKAERRRLIREARAERARAQAEAAE